MGCDWLPRQECYLTMPTTLPPHHGPRLKSILLGVVLVALVAGAVLWLGNLRSKESSEVAYWTHGSAWMDPTLTWEENSKKRSAALKAIGEPAVTVLIADLQRGDERPNTWMSFLTQSRLSQASQKFGARQATFLLGEMGLLAKAAVPELIKLLTHEDRMVRQDSARAIGAIGDSSPAVFASLKSLYSDPAAEVRQAAVVAVWRLDHTDAEAASRIDSFLLNTNRSKHELAGTCYLDLIALGPDAKRFGPACAAGMTNIPSLVAKALAAKTLWRTTGSTEGAIYALSAITNAIADAPHPPNSRSNPVWGVFGDLFFAVQELCEIQDFRISVIPSLVALTNSPNEMIANTASNHLDRINKLNATNQTVQ
jgi:hypothetical protein